MMHRLVLDSATSAKLQNSGDSLELCDNDGRTLGYFLPPELHQRLLYAWAKSQFTDEELEQARKEPGGMATADAIEYLNTLAQRGSKST